MNNAIDIRDLLAVKHAKDVFVSECKNGPTWFGSHLRMDAWAMKRSWSKPLTVAYEIKVSRSDFLQDSKWPGYLDYCNEFYFVCPPKLIDKSEVGENAGLIWTSANCARLYTKKKAPYRDVAIPEDLWRHILMSRAVITRETRVEHDEKSYWQRWMRQKKVDMDFGRMVGRRIGEVIKEKIYDVETANHVLEKQNEKFADLRKFLESIDIDPESWHYSLKNTTERRLKELDSAVPKELLKDLKDVGRAIDSAVDSYERAKQ